MSVADEVSLEANWLTRELTAGSKVNSRAGSDPVAQKDKFRDEPERYRLSCEI